MVKWINADVVGSRCVPESQSLSCYLLSAFFLAWLSPCQSTVHHLLDTELSLEKSTAFHHQHTVLYALREGVDHQHFHSNCHSYHCWAKHLERKHPRVTQDPSYPCFLKPRVLAGPENVAFVIPISASTHPVRMPQSSPPLRGEAGTQVSDPSFGYPPPPQSERVW